MLVELRRTCWQRGDILVGCLDAERQHPSTSYVKKKRVVDTAVGGRAIEQISDANVRAHTSMDNRDLRPLDHCDWDWDSW